MRNTRDFCGLIRVKTESPQMFTSDRTAWPLIGATCGSKFSRIWCLLSSVPILRFHPPTEGLPSREGGNLHSSLGEAYHRLQIICKHTVAAVMIALFPVATILNNYSLVQRKTQSWGLSATPGWHWLAVDTCLKLIEASRVDGLRRKQRRQSTQYFYNSFSYLYDSHSYHSPLHCYEVSERYNLVFSFRICLFVTFLSIIFHQQRNILKSV